MAIGVQRLDHVNVTVPAAQEAAARRFYVRDPGGNRIEIAAGGE